MIFKEVPITGAYLVEIEPHRDERGWFARTFDREEFERLGLEPVVEQCNISYNERAGTLRGMHYQADPQGEPKLIRCTRGAIFDVLVDLRPDSSTYTRWHGVELTPENARALYAPIGVAHGFQTLVDGSEVQYQMGHRYVPEAARGVRWNDPAIDIDWPHADQRIVSERDAAYADFRP